MSHKRKHRSGGLRLPLPVVTFAGVLLIAGAIFLGVRRESGTPVLAVDRDRIDYGVMQNNTPTSFQITVTNNGDGVLRFVEEPYVEVVDGCCPPKLTVGSMSLEPGESTTVSSAVFMMHEGMDGPHDFRVHLLTNDPAQPDKEVQVLSVWE